MTPLFCNHFIQAKCGAKEKGVCVEIGVLHQSKRLAPEMNSLKGKTFFFSLQHRNLLHVHEHVWWIQKETYRQDKINSNILYPSNCILHTSKVLRYFHSSAVHMRKFLPPSRNFLGKQKKCNNLLGCLLFCWIAHTFQIGSVQ